MHLITTESLRLEQMFQDHLGYPPVQEGSTYAAFSVLFPVGFSLSPRMEASQTLYQPISVLNHVYSKNVFSYAEIEFIVLESMFVAVSPVTGHH